LTVFTEDTIDESGSEQLSVDEEDDVFDELNESMNKKTAKKTGHEWLKHRDTASPATPSPDSTKGDVDLTENQVSAVLGLTFFHWLLENIPSRTSHLKSKILVFSIFMSCG
jgi:hypothetical protein